jgi:hypothetical protein
MWQLKEREWVAARLGRDPIAHSLVEWTPDNGREQLLCIGVVQPADGELRQHLEEPPAARLAHREDQPDRLRAEAARDERQRLLGGHVEPLGIVHDADSGRSLRDIGKQTRERQADEEATQRTRFRGRWSLKAGAPETNCEPVTTASGPRPGAWPTLALTLHICQVNRQSSGSTVRVAVCCPQWRSFVQQPRGQAADAQKRQSTLPR